jgi:hypothetical protein
MSIAELKAEVATLSRKERKELADYLAQLEKLFPPELVKELTAKINDKNPDRWLSLEEVKRRLGD